MKRSESVALLAAALVGALLAGCVATGGEVKTPEEAIQLRLEAWRGAMMNQDVDGIMALFSENFAHVGWNDKPGARRFIQDAMQGGYLDDVEVRLDDAAIKVDGGMASVYPVGLAGSFGALTMEFFLTLERDGWLLTGLDAPGM